MSDEQAGSSSADDARATPGRGGARCPRCGSRLGVLGDAPRGESVSLYCGCCGLVVADAR